MINREEILKDLDEASGIILDPKQIKVHNNEEMKYILDNYKNEFIIFRNNIRRLSDNIVLSAELEMSINNFIVNMKLLTTKIINLNKQNK